MTPHEGVAGGSRDAGLLSPAAVEAPAPVRLDTIAQALDALRRGLPVLVVDDADRENEGDIILAAQKATPVWMGWTVRHSSGVLCAPMPGALADRLNLPPMVARNEDARQTAYTISVDAARGVSTGISARDRTTTVRLLAAQDTTASDLIRPGHVFPLRARDGGVLERRGHTEAAVDLCRLAGLAPVGVIGEVVGDDGELLRLPGLRRLADEHGLPLISIADLADHLRSQGRAVAAPREAEAGSRSGRAARARVQRTAETVLPTRSGTFRALGYRDLLTGQSHVALLGTRAPTRGSLVRVHSECLTGDIMGSLRCDCGPQLSAALDLIDQHGGAVIYLRGHEGRGIGLLAKLLAYQLQEDGLDTVSANTVQGLPVDAREYGAAAAILADLDLDDVRLLTNNPAKVEGLREHGVRVREAVGLSVGASLHNTAYLTAKRDMLGHTLDLRLGSLDSLAQDLS